MTSIRMINVQHTKLETHIVALPTILNDIQKNDKWPYYLSDIHKEW
jgi:hypothetical protein